MTTISQNLTAIQERIDQAALAAGRDLSEIQLVTVTKTIAIDTIRQAIDAGVTVLGENYIQEARAKFEQISALPVAWHFIGHLQTNKAKYAVRQFDLIHTVDSSRLAAAINREAAKIDKVQKVLIQINISQEETKAGIETENAADLAGEIAQMDHLSLKGLMTMPPFFNAPERVRPFFRQLSEIRDQLRQMNLPGVDLTELSMGMTGDFEVAIAEGATLGAYRHRHFWRPGDEGALAHLLCPLRHLSHRQTARRRHRSDELFLPQQYPPLYRMPASGRDADNLRG